MRIALIGADMYFTDKALKQLIEENRDTIDHVECGRGGWLVPWKVHMKDGTTIETMYPSEITTLSKNTVFDQVFFATLPGITLRETILNFPHIITLRSMTKYSRVPDDFVAQQFEMKLTGW